ncbi:MAG: hypothetical protein ABSF64_25740 [Bryobacteraceae bacterium]|jgi:flagellar biosynthesis protein FlhF
MAIVGNAQHLHVKSFFAATVKEALEQGHQELGPDALLVNAREAPPEARHLGVCEVVLGVGGATGVTPPAPARDRRVDEALVEAGIPPEMAREIDQAVQQRIHRGPVVQMTPAGGAYPWNTETLASETAAEIASRLEVRSGVGRVTALVGPPGAGKTTTLVKLAVQEGLRAGRSTRLISADTQRIGGAEQLRTFAAILGVAFQAVESSAALAQAISAASACDLVLIDTPGYGHVLQSELGCDLAEFLGRRQDIDTHLVLTACTQASVLRKLVDAHLVYRPSKLLFTRLDDVESLAPVFCEAVQRQMPLSYFSIGQLIPEDLEAANKERVTESLVRKLPADLQAVA